MAGDCKCITTAACNGSNHLLVTGGPARVHRHVHAAGKEQQPKSKCAACVISSMVTNACPGPQCTLFMTHSAVQCSAIKHAEQSSARDVVENQLPIQVQVWTPPGRLIKQHH